MGFSRFDISPALLKAVTDLGYAEPTPIQAQAIPEALNGRDLRGAAQTGTGKTCAFVIPMVERLTRTAPTARPSALVLAPTRELAAQIVQVIHSLIKGTRLRTALVLGGVNINHQVREMRAGVDIVVATPGRLMDLINQNAVSLRGISLLVLDEADRMLDMGFLPDIKRIVATTPPTRQTMLFSATFEQEILRIAQQFLRNPVVVDVAPVKNAASQNVTQMAYPVSQDQKRALLQALLELGNMTSALVFTRTKHGADRVLRYLRDTGKRAAVIHANRSQNQRQAALDGFKRGQYQILVATDIAARGIDVKDISHVINYDVPRHAEDYVHRIGRTGRAQSVGEAFTLVSPDEEPYLRKIESFIKKPIPRSVIPDFPYGKRPQVFPQGAPAERRTHEPHRPGHAAPHTPSEGQTFPEQGDGVARPAAPKPSSFGKKRFRWHHRRRR